MKNILLKILSIIIGLGGLFLIGIAKQFDNIYLVDSIWMQTDIKFFIIILGIISIILAFKFAFCEESEVEK